MVVGVFIIESELKRKSQEKNTLQTMQKKTSQEGKARQQIKKKGPQ